jgi:flagellar biosynthesis GTPase FlhF
VARSTSSNGIVASKAAPQSAAFKSAAKAATKSAASKATSKSAAPQPTAIKSTAKSAASQHTTSKSAAPLSKSAASQHTSKSAAPKSAPTSKSVAFEQQLSQVTMTTREDSDQDSDKEFAVGGLLYEDDSQERELALSSPLRGNELRAAKKVGLIFFSPNTN